MNEIDRQIPWLDWMKNNPTSKEKYVINTNVNILSRFYSFRNDIIKLLL